VPTFEFEAESPQLKNTVAFAAGLVMLTCAHAGAASNKHPTLKLKRPLGFIIVRRTKRSKHAMREVNPRSQRS
jgi:hypothetical protein